MAPVPNLRKREPTLEELVMTCHNTTDFNKCQEEARLEWEQRTEDTKPWTWVYYLIALFVSAVIVSCLFWCLKHQYIRVQFCSPEEPEEIESDEIIEL